MAVTGEALGDAIADARSGAHGGGLFVASVEKAFRVLHLFTSAKVQLSFSEVAQRSGIGKSAAQRFLYTLHTLGYLIQDPASRSYRLSSKLLALSQSYSRTDVLREKASALLEEANRRTEETVNLTVLDGTEVVYILRFPSKHVVSVNLTVGTRLPAFCTAPGRAILAHLEPREADRVLAGSRLLKRTETTRTDPDLIRKALEQARRQGYCITDQEAFVGDISIAAPVFDEAGAVIAAVNVAVPTPRWSMARARRKLAAEVKDVARRISDALSHDVMG
jgi:PcaR/PcaU/PobR family beta-ketoadipate pathway transcriptional regulator